MADWQKSTIIITDFYAWSLQNKCEHVKIFNTDASDRYKQDKKVVLGVVHKSCYCIHFFILVGYKLLRTRCKSGLFPRAWIKMKHGVERAYFINLSLTDNGWSWMRSFSTLRYEGSEEILVVQAVGYSKPPSYYSFDDAYSWVTIVEPYYLMEFIKELTSTGVIINFWLDYSINRSKNAS